MQKKIKNFDIEEHIVNCDVSYRGGTLKIDVSDLFDTGEEEAIMGASQNYLGGGMAGKITTGRMFDISGFSKADKKAYEDLSARIVKYFYNLNAGGGDDYMVENVNSLTQNKRLPVSGY